MLAILPNGRITLARADGTVELWGPFSGQRIGRLPALRDPRLWDPNEDPEMVLAVSALPDGRLAAGENDGSVRIWDVARRKVAATLRGHAGKVCALALLPDGRIASSGRDRTILIWDRATERPIARIATQHIDAIKHLVPFPGGRLVSASAAAVMLWDVERARLIDVLAMPTTDFNDVVGVRGDWLAMGMIDGTIRLIAPQSYRSPEPIRAQTRSVASLCPLPGDRLASGGFDDAVRTWRLRDGAELSRHQLDFVPSGIALHPDGRLIAANRHGRLAFIAPPA